MKYPQDQSQSSHLLYLQGTVQQEQFNFFINSQASRILAAIQWVNEIYLQVSIIDKIYKILSNGTSINCNKFYKTQVQFPGNDDL